MRKDKGFTNGVGKKSNHTGFTNGMSKKGYTNGQASGFTNGMAKDEGFTNGSVNGTKIDHTSFEKKKNSRTKLFAQIVIIILLFSSIAFLIGSEEELIVTSIDGSYKEWDNGMINIGFANFGMKEEQNTIYMALERDNILEGDGNITESYMIFINDKNSDDGFYLGYDTYEYQIEVYGNNNSIVGSQGYQFDEYRNNSDWNGFKSRYNTFGLKKSNNNSFMEIGINTIQLGKTKLNNMEMLIYHFDPNGVFEYSQVLDYNTTINYRSDQTRSNEIYYEHFFEKNELHINTENSFAYSYIPYEIKILKERIESTEVSNSTTESKPTKVITPIIAEKDCGITFKIDYQFVEDDIIYQCGGIIINTTCNVTLNDDGIIIYHMNHTVKSITMTGNFGTNTVFKKGTRSTYINLQFPDQNNQYGSITDMGAFYTSSTPTIDGTLSANEWDDADTYTADCTKDLKIHTMRDDTYIYIALESLDDTLDNPNDRGYAYFDCDHDATANPDANDKSIRNLGGVTTYWEGDGSTWGNATIPTGWTSAEGTTSTYKSFEFRVTISELNETGGFWQDGDEVGFGCAVKNEQPFTENDFWIWYPDNYEQADTPTTSYHYKPDTWGDLYYDIPEFNDVILLGIGLLILNVVMFGKKRRRVDDEE